MSRGRTTTNQTFFAGEPVPWPVPSDTVVRQEVMTSLSNKTCFFFYPIPTLVVKDNIDSVLPMLSESNQPSLRARRINCMLILVFLALNNAAPSYISDLFTERQTWESVYGANANMSWLVTPRVNTTNYGLHSFRYHTSKLSNYGTCCRMTSLCLLLLLPSKLH